jgi:hypothetical protein
MTRTILIVIIVVAVMVLAPFPAVDMQQTSIDELRADVLQLRLEILGKFMNNVVENPGLLFDSASTNPGWEAAKALPYSKCYRHLIDATTADFIICQAI